MNANICDSKLTYNLIIYILISFLLVSTSLDISSGTPNLQNKSQRHLIKPREPVLEVPLGVENISDQPVANALQRAMTLFKPKHARVMNFV